ncbi:DUF6233 domain-containing protein [Streptomyces sp. NPDC048258]|uniref:DUF6233 domain-containing protein n=1 Tax=Streptomyces sp. NPDC048258 TaxID=3365527 RepID=UPI003719D10E
MLQPYRCVAYDTIPAHKVPVQPPAPTKWGWVIRPVHGRRGRAIIHESDCPLAEESGEELRTEDALDALLRPGVEACHDCGAAAVLIPALQLGEGRG